MNSEVCSKCPIYNDGFLQSEIRKTCKVQPRFISNPGKLKVLAEFEAPGMEECSQNLVLVGRSGQLINDCFSKVGLDKYDIKLTNVVKCRPIKFENNKYKNKTPNQEEIDACSSYLKEDFDFNPDLVILFGKIACQSLLPNKVYSDIRGKGTKLLFNDKGYNAFITYHPSYILRDPTAKPIFLTHLEKCVGYLESLQIEGEIK